MMIIMMVAELKWRSQNFRTGGHWFTYQVTFSVNESNKNTKTSSRNVKNLIVSSIWGPRSISVASIRSEYRGPQTLIWENAQTLKVVFRNCMPLFCVVVVASNNFGLGRYDRWTSNQNKIISEVRDRLWIDAPLLLDYATGLEEDWPAGRRRAAPQGRREGSRRRRDWRWPSWTTCADCADGPRPTEPTSYRRESTAARPPAAGNASEDLRRRPFPLYWPTSSSKKPLTWAASRPRPNNRRRAASQFRDRCLYRKHEMNAECQRRYEVPLYASLLWFAWFMPGFTL